jgi:uncharacterized protein with GYD domain
MPKYLYVGSYTADGVKGVLKEGGSSRRDAVQRLIESAGGKLEALYFALGETDFYIVADFPDNVSSLSATLLVNASGTVRTKTVALLTPEEVDEATKKSAEYRPPGG